MWLVSVVDIAIVIHVEYLSSIAHVCSSHIDSGTVDHQGMLVEVTFPNGAESRPFVWWEDH